MRLSVKLNILWIFFFVFLNFSNLKSAHVVGGEMTYRCLDSNMYEVTLILFRDCSPGQTGFSNTARFYYFDGSTGTRLSRPYIPLDTSFIVPVNAVSSCLIVPPGNCLEQAIYIDTILLPPDSNGYDISYNLRNRTNGSINMFNNNVSIALTTRIPPNDTLCNSSPTFNSFPPTILCINDPINIDYSATDDDGDSLVYDFFTPFFTGSGWGGVISAPPYTPINWATGFSQNNQVTSSPSLQIDSLTGLITGTPTSLGWYITGVSVKEYRNGVLINETRRDFLMKIVNCFPTTTAISNPGVAGVVCNSFTVNFGNNSSGTPLTTYLWDFGDTTTTTDTSTLISPQYTYSDTGVFTVTLISDPYSTACADTATQQIRLYPIIAPTYIKPANQCLTGNSFAFNAGGAYFGTTQVEWDFGSTASSSTDTTLTPSGIIYSSSGLKSISLRYKDYGCDTTFYDTIEVYDNPVSNFSFSDNNCIDFTVQFSDSSLFSSDHYWDFGDTNSVLDTSTSINPIFVFPDTGTYTVMLIVGSLSSICPDTSYKQVRIDPILNPFYNKPSNQCLIGNSFNFNAGGAFFDSTIIEWDFGSTATPNTSTNQNPTGITFNSSGNKVVSIRYRDFGCDTTFTDTIEVYDNPVSNFSFSDNNCKDFYTQFIDSSLFPGDWFWDFGIISTLSDTSISQKANVIYADSGNYNVMLIVGSKTSICPDTSYKLLRINPILNPFFSKPSNQCLLGNSFDFSAGGAFFDSTLIEWDFGSTATPSTSTNQNPTGITFNNIGKKVISLRYRDFNCDTIFYDSIEVYQSPIANFAFTDNHCINHTIKFNDSSLHSGNYFWDFGDTNSTADTSNSANPTYTYPDSGIYTVMLVVDSNSSICPDTIYQQVTIYPILDPFFNKPVNQCILGNSFDFSAGGSFYDSTLIDWDFGPTATPSTSTNKNPTGITFSSIGKKVISLRYRDFGCDTTIFDTIEVHQSPVANFDFTDNHCVNQTIQFSDSSLHTGNYFWDFGDINSITDTSYSKNPSFTYPDSGTYSVMLVADSNSSICPDTMYQQIIIHPILNPFFSTPMDQCLLGNSFNFNAGGAFFDTTLIDWDFGSTATPNTSTNQNPTGIVFSSSGKKAITIRYRDFGCDTSFTDTIEIFETPVSNFSYSENNCVDFNIQFYDSSLFVGDYYWDFGVISSTNDTSTSANPSFTYPDSGTYTIMLIAGSQYLSCPDTSYQQIRIDPILNPHFIKPTDQCLLGNSFNFNAGGAFFNTTQIDWDFGSSATPSSSTNQNPTGIVFSSSGKKAITIRYRDFGCDTTFIDTIEVFETPVSNFSFSENNCVDFNIQFYDSSLFVGDYYWDFGVTSSTNDTSTSANPSFTYPDSGTYTLMLIAGSQYLSCPDTSYQQIRIDPILNPYFDKPANQCFTGNSFNFSSGGAFFNTTQIDWDFGNSATPSTSTNQNPTGIVFNTPGKKAVTIRYRDFGCDTTFTDTIHVYELPVANFEIDHKICVDLVVKFYDSSLYAGKYEWDFGVPLSTTDTSSAINPIYSYVDTGTYTVRLIVSSQYLLCAPDTLYKQVSIYPVLKPEFNLPNNQCFVGNSFNFTGFGIYYPTTKFSWDFGSSATPNSDTTLNPPSIIFNTSGKKPVTFTFTDFKCVIDFIDTIEVYDNPISNFGFIDNNCHDLSVQFVDSTSFTTEYYWDFGDTNSTNDTSTSANPIFTFPDSGVYTIRLIADGNTSLCPDTSYKQISLNPILAPYYNKPANQCLTGNSFNFSTGGIYFDSTQIDWDFGANATPSSSSNLNPTGIVYSTSGLKIVSIRFRDFGCDTTFYDTIEVYDNPLSDFSFSNNNCVDLTAQFTTLSLFPGDHYWDFGDTNSLNDTSTLANPSFTYPDSGVYTVMLIVGSSSSICPDTSYQQIRVYPILSPFYAKPVNQCFNGNSFDFSAGGIYFNTTQVDWDFGSSATPSTSSSLNPTGITFNTVGKKAIKIRYQDFGCDTTFVDTIEVYNSPLSNFSFSNNNCIDFTIQFSNLSLYADYYHWDFGVTSSTNDTSNLTNPSFTFPDSGTYTAMLVAGTFSSICPDTTYLQVRMNPLLNPYFNVPNNQCFNGNSFDFSAGGTYFNTTQIDWDFGSTANQRNSASQNPVGVTFNSIGLKPISLRYRDFGCDTTFYDTIEVYNSPSSNFSFSNNNCVDLNIQFTNLSNFADFYHWDFGVTTSSSDISTSANPSFTFPDSGTYTVMLVAGTNSSICPDTSYQQVTMHSLLVPYFNKPMNQCVIGNSFDFTAGGAYFNTTQIDWDFGSTATPSTSTNTNPTGITFNSIGKKPISIRYRAFGCDTTFYDTIEVYQSPISNFSFSENNCVDLTIQFSDSSLHAGNYYWDFGVPSSTTDTSTSPNPSFTFPDSGTYTVMYVIDSNSSICPDTSYQQVVMHPLLNPYFSVPMNQCINGNSFDFNAGGSYYGNTQIDWDFGASATPSTASGANPTGITFNTVGKKPITIRYRANGCDTSFTDTIEVYVSPYANFSFSDNNCFNYFIQFSDSSLDSKDYYWNFGDTTTLADTSTLANPSYTFPDSGTYTVMLVMGRNSSICPDTLYQQVIMYPLLNPFFTAPMNQCLNYNSFNLNAGGAYYGTTQIDWDFGASATPSTFTGANPTGVSFNSVGMKYITIRYRANGCDTSFMDSVEIYPSPLADFIIYEDEYCIGDSLKVDFASLSDTNYLHYWNFGDTGTSTQVAPVYVYPDTGTYGITLVVENSYGCLDTMFQNNSINIYPSPTALFTPLNLKTSYYYPYVEFINGSLNFTYSTFDDGAGTIVSPFSRLRTDYEIEGFYYPILIVENDYACFDTLMGEIFYESKYNMFVPNSFTPNGDGVNDIFIPVMNIDSNYTMAIFTRWGEKIFETNSVTKGWDGKDSQGVVLKVDTYVYRIVYRDPKSKAREIIGHVNLVK